MKLKSMTERVVSKRKFPPVLYGLAGIMELFDCSKATAFRYRHTVISGACTQHGKKIIVDTRKALKLFGVEHPENMVMERQVKEKVKEL